MNMEIKHLLQALLISLALFHNANGLQCLKCQSIHVEGGFMAFFKQTLNPKYRFHLTPACLSPDQDLGSIAEETCEEGEYCASLDVALTVFSKEDGMHTTLLIMTRSCLPRNQTLEECFNVQSIPGTIKAVLSDLGSWENPDIEGGICYCSDSMCNTQDFNYPEDEAGNMVDLATIANDLGLCIDGQGGATCDLEEDVTDGQDSTISKDNEFILHVSFTPIHAKDSSTRQAIPAGTIIPQVEEAIETIASDNQNVTELVQESQSTISFIDSLRKILREESNETMESLDETTTLDGGDAEEVNTEGNPEEMIESAMNVTEEAYSDSGLPPELQEVLQSLDDVPEEVRQQLTDIVEENYDKLASLDPLDLEKLANLTGLDLGNGAGEKSLISYHTIFMLIFSVYLLIF